MQNWRNALLLMLGLGLAGCNLNPYIPAIPFKAGLPEQVAVMEFKLIASDPFLLGLLVNWPEEAREAGSLQRSLEIYEDVHKIFNGGGIGGHGDGTLLPLHVRVFRNNKLIADEYIETRGTDGGISFCFDKKAQREAEFVGFWRSLFFGDYGLHCENGDDMRRVSGIHRAIKPMMLSPGDYRIEVATVQYTEAFSKLDLYLTMGVDDPKI